jgi:hypothetical protein
LRSFTSSILLAALLTVAATAQAQETVELNAYQGATITTMFPDGHLMVCPVDYALLRGSFSVFGPRLLEHARVNVVGQCWFTSTPLPPEHCGGPGEIACSPAIVPGVSTFP